MKMVHLLSATALAGSMFGAQGALAETTPAATAGAAAVAQEQPAQANADQAAAGQDDSDAGTITVTGTRIRQPNLESTIPVLSVSGEEFFQTGQVSIGDVLNDLPQLHNTYSQQNSTRFLGTRGLNLLDLRNLGTQRTLVLVNGRRHVAGDILVNGVSPDINTFPTDLIERVDVVTGGNSSIYGSDAIAGVVNFILKDHYDGFQIRGQAGVNLDYKDAGNQYVSALIGKNFADDRGNIAVNLEYAHQSRYFGSGRPNLRQNDNFVVTDTDTAATGINANNGDGVFDRTFFRDIRSATISTGGQIAIYQGANAQCGKDVLGATFTCSYLFQPDGTLIQQNGTRVGIGPNGNFIGGNGYSGREGQLLTLSPDLERVSVNVLGHFEVSPAFVPFIEAKYVRSKAFGSVSGPFFSQGTTLADPANRERVRLDNPYLSAQARAVLTQQFLLDTDNLTNPNATSGTGAITAAAAATQRAAINNGSFRFSLRKNYVELGIRDEEITRETYRAVAGIRGEFNDDWNYELSANYGEHRENNIIIGNVNTQRFLLAIDTTRDANGNIVCRSQIDPAARLASPSSDGNAAILAADVAACVPLNPFGDQASSAAVRNYLLVDSRANGKITQFVANGYVAGDFSQLFELPGGPIAFSVGAEYRREKNFYDLDDLTQRGYAFYNAIPAFTAPAFEVKEAFGELSVPLLKDKWFAHSLTLSASGRVADYKGSVGTVYAYTLGGEFAPISDIRFRGSYSTSVRAPNLSELYSSQSQNFAPGFADPCSARNINTGSSTRVANCTAAGRPANYDFVYQQSLEIVSGGNPALKQEKGKSYTIGGIIEPRFLPGFSASVDYYNIEVKDVITSVAAQTIVNQCYDAATLDNPFCSLFRRAPASGGPRGEENFRILEGSLLQSTLNFAKLKARGIDTNIAYTHKFDWGNISAKGIWTHFLQRDNFTNPVDPNRINRILGELGDPTDEVSFKAGVKLGKVTFGYDLHWIDKMYVNTYEDVNSLQGRPPENEDAFPVKYYPDVFYHDARVDFDIDDRFNMYLGVDNFTNKKPPLGLSGVGAGSGIYDVRGRYGYVGVVAKF